MLKYQKCKNVVELDALIGAAILSAGTMRDNVQIAAIAILAHAEEHGDYTRATTLVDGLGDGVNSAALVEFFTRFGGLIVDEENGGFNGWNKSEHIRANFEEAKKVHWHTLKKVNPWQGYSLDSALNKLADQHLKQAKRLAALPEDSPERVKFEMAANNATIQRVLGLVNMEAIVIDEDEQSQLPLEGDEAAAADIMAALEHDQSATG